eukprot:15459608-Alexandrium_andersonii.AAC.1
MAEDASCPVAREASGPPAPGARPRGGRLAVFRRPEPHVTYTAAGSEGQAWREWARPVAPAVAAAALPAIALRGSESMGRA